MPRALSNYVFYIDILVCLLFLSLHLCATKTCIFNISDCFLSLGRSSLTIMAMEYCSSTMTFCMYFYLCLYCTVESKNRLGLFLMLPIYWVFKLLVPWSHFDLYILGTKRHRFSILNNKVFRKPLGYLLKVRVITRKRMKK